MSKITLCEVAERLKTQDNILILCHRSPDGDTIGSAYALYYALTSMGKTCTVDCSDEIPLKYDYITKPAKFKSFTPEYTVAVDVADKPMLGKKYDKITPDLVIDHHISNTLYGKESCVIDNGANCENIYELIKILGADIDINIANALYTGIATDTGCFKFSNTTANTHIIAAQLITDGADIQSINRVMFEVKTRSRLEVERYVYDKIEIFADGKAAIVAIPYCIVENANAKSEDLDGITGLPRQIDGVVLGITLREQKDGSLRVSVRTHPPVDASKFCSAFGGGGHIRAAGCSVAGNISDAVQQLKSKALETLGDLK